MKRSKFALIGLTILMSPAAALFIPRAANAAACAPAWVSTTAYVGGNTVSEGGINYLANWWTQGNDPATNNGGSGSGQPWTSQGACGGATCSTKPNAPTGLAASGTTSSGTTLNWGTVTAPANCTISGYTVYKAGTSIGTATGTSFSVTGLSASTTYTFTVAATDASGTGSQSSSISVTTLAASCTASPSAPTGLAASGTTSSGTTLTWNAVTAPSGCSISGYTVYKAGAALATVSGTTYSPTGLTASTTYSFTVAAVDGHGTSAQSSAVSVTTQSGSSGGTTTTGSVFFHASLANGSGHETLTITGGNYDDLIMSNIISGVMLSHMVKEFYPGIQYNQDYLIGSDFAQLLQENIATYDYVDTQNVIDPASEQQAVFGVGQGGPYQINSYGYDMVGGGTAPVGHSLINYIAIQKNIGYTMANASTQYTKATPLTFNDKYYGPMLPAFFHYNDMVALNVIGKGAGGWVTPWEPDYDNCLAHFVSLPNSFLDMILNVAYNEGYYGGLVKSYSVKGETATASTVASVNSYSTIWGDTSTYDQYPYQVHYYLDQLYDNPVPNGSPTTLVTPTNHVAIPISTLQTVFSNVFQKLDYSNGTAAAQYFTSAQATSAFTSALSSNGVSSTATYDLSNASNRATIFTVLDKAIGNLETTSGMKFNATTTNQL